MRTGVACKWLGVWLLTTAALVVYGETAPSTTTPDFSWAIMSLVAGILTYYTGCLCCRRARGLPVSSRRGNQER